MYNLISCEYNMDTGCVELWFLDGSRISIDCTAVRTHMLITCTSVLNGTI